MVPVVFVEEAIDEGIDFAFFLVEALFQILRPLCDLCGDFPAAIAALQTLSRHFISTFVDFIARTLTHRLALLLAADECNNCKNAQNSQHLRRLERLQWR
jgi:hypothetical protein